MFGKKKQVLLPQKSSRKSTTWYRKTSSFSLVAATCIFLILRRDTLPRSSLVIGSGETRSETFKWSGIIPSSRLEWSDCFEEFQCAKLDLPLDWLDPSNETRIALAIIRLEATEKDDYKGPVFVNPGGPGGSGVSMVKSSGKFLQTIVGKNHDIISFDPRGVGISTPRISCYPSLQTTEIWNLLEPGLIDSHPGVLYDAWARAITSSLSCNEAIGGSNTSALKFGSRDYSNNDRNVMAAGPGRFVSTASVARDMLEILNKGGWDKLRYWGFSYGTVLGGTFAALYPDRVERMVNDGNVNLIQWATNSHNTFLQDSEKVMQAFYTFCHSSGPSICPFYMSSPSLIELRLDTLLDTLKIRPVIVPGSLTENEFPQIISYSSVKRFISTVLYRPIVLFPVLAEILVALEGGDGVPFLKLTKDWGMRLPSVPVNNCQDGSGSGSDEEVLEMDSGDDIFRVVMCSDGGEMTDTVEEFGVYADNLIQVSKSAAAVQCLGRMSCASLKVQAKWRHTGPFIANTSHPILFIANTADNVTPLQSASNNSAGFADSVVLVQEAFGHTSLAAPSICTASHIRNYFQHGFLPKPDTKCNSDVEPFLNDSKPHKTENLAINLFNKELGEVKIALLHLMESNHFAVRAGV